MIKRITIPDELIKKINDRVIEHFKDICNVVPRGSKKETAMCEYLKKFTDGLKQKGIKAEIKHQSETREGKPINNVVITKAASKGYEEADAVALQAHLDMVCQKIENSEHNFLTQPIEHQIIDGKMTSKNMETTLGADDGIGVACIMAILESDELQHPEIQAVFTSDEEDGMSGAKWLDKEMVTAKRFINIDAETEGLLYYGCAGGIYANISIPAMFNKTPNKAKQFKIEVSGLQGGHSGLMIDKGRANANRLMGRILNSLFYDFKGNGEIFIADISGGDAKNAITKKSTAVIAVSDIEAESLKDKITELEKVFRYEFNSDNSEEFEPNLSVQVNDCENTYENVLTAETSNKIITALMTVPNGVLDMSTRVHGLVETSSNMGVIKLDGPNITLTCFVRSSVESKKLFIVEQIKLIAEGIGAGFKADTDFPEWNPNIESPLLKLFVSTYKDIFEDKEAEYESVHAGLECGYFFKKFFDDLSQTSVDLIAIGPTIDNAHVPTETLHMDTTIKIVKLLLNVLARMKDKTVFESCVSDMTIGSTISKKHVHNCNCMI